MKELTGRKILFVITKSNLGGAQKYIYELAVHVQEAGGIPIVACGGTGAKASALGGLVDMLQNKHIPVRIVNNFMRNMSPIQDIKALMELIQLIRKERPDVLHVTSSKAGGLGAFAGRICRVPCIVFTSHGLTFDETWRPAHQRFAIKIMTWWTLILAHQSIMISKDTHATAASLPLVSKKIHLIYNGIRRQLLVSKKEARTILTSDTNTTQKIWVGGIGELHQNKNWLLLIEAIAQLPENIYCVIIGEGDQRPILEQRIKELHLEKRVLLAGFVQGASSLLPAYDIFVLPSKKEGLPYVLMEAGQAHCAVACSAISGNTDIIQDGENGILFTHTLESITHTITALSSNKSRRTIFGEALYTDMQEKFSIANMVTKTFEIYQSKK